MTNAELAKALKMIGDSPLYSIELGKALHTLASEVAARPEPLGPLAVLNDFVSKCDSIGWERPAKMVFAKRGAQQLASDLSTGWVLPRLSIEPLSGSVLGIEVEQAPDPAPLRLWATRPLNPSITPELRWSEKKPYHGAVEIPTVRG